MLLSNGSVTIELGREEHITAFLSSGYKVVDEKPKAEEKPKAKPTTRKK